MRKKIFTAICFFHVREQKQPLKYRNIVNKEKFCSWIATKGVIYVNWYDKETKQYDGRQWIQQKITGI